MNNELETENLWLAARTLLVRPLLRSGGPDAAVAAIIRRSPYREQLQSWFEHNLGWKLVVDRDVIRLHKVPVSAATDEREAPNQRCCVLYCLALAALEECGEQTVISELGEKVSSLSATRVEIPTYDPAEFRDRRELTSAIRLLVEHGALVPTQDDAVTQQDERSYLHGAGNALYDVDHRAAALLLACPVPPSRAGTPSGLTQEAVPDTVDGLNRRRRHLLMRRLVDDPVLYLAELPEDQQNYFRTQRPMLVRELADMLDVRVEVRAEGAAIIDDELTGLRFPFERTPQFAALLLADALAEEPGVQTGQSAVVSDLRLIELSWSLADKVAEKVKTIEQLPVTPTAVLSVARTVLVMLRLAEPVQGGLRVLPALARYRDAARGSARLAQSTTVPTLPGTGGAN
ncbi:TIGR02678 family protein [Crossiella sp. CA198]|uniref:TIGR02678 family protein n=1 Tax=Crossiella sp. CA198 TaxID=3455607 RepID=UPI003F8D352D